MSPLSRLAVGVLAAGAAAPFLFILWYALGIVAFGLSVGADPSWWVYVVYYGGTAALVALDATIGYLAWRSSE